MIQDDFEPSVPRLLLLVVDFQDASSLDLGSLFAEAVFEKVLPSDFVLGVDEHAEDGFAVVGIHLEALVRERLECLATGRVRSKIELGAMGGKSLAKCAKELCAPD